MRERLGIDDIALVLEQNRLCWHGHVLWKDDDDWVKKCMKYEVEGPKPGGRPKKTWREVVKEKCQARKLNTEDGMDRSKWRKLIKDVRWPGWAWVGECFFWYRPTRVVPDQRPLNGCVCVGYWGQNMDSTSGPVKQISNHAVDGRGSPHIYVNQPLNG